MELTPREIEALISAAKAALERATSYLASSGDDGAPLTVFVREEADALRTSLPKLRQMLRQDLAKE